MSSCVASCFFQGNPGSFAELDPGSTRSAHEPGLVYKKQPAHRIRFWAENPVKENWLSLTGFSAQKLVRVADTQCSSCGSLAAPYVTFNFRLRWLRLSFALEWISSALLSVPAVFEHRDARHSPTAGDERSHTLHRHDVGGCGRPPLPESGRSARASHRIARAKSAG